MDTIVDRIRALCQQKETSITKIEKELGYANGTIGKWKLKNRKAPLEKVIEVAKLLGTSPEYLQTGEEQKKSPPHGGEPPAITDWEKALDGKGKEELKEIIDIAMKKFMEQQ